jgi:glyoxylase-like metal-dependent hydrolase (beta-lactamase superfamily II)
MALAVDQLELGPLGTNCYVVRASAQATEAVVVDPSGAARDIVAKLDEHGARCVAILVTHGHWDHLLGVADLAGETGAPVHMPEGERVLLEEAQRFAPEQLPVRAYTPEVLLSGGETLELAGIAFEVTAVPGHSPAHLAYYADGDLFSGDVLFAASVGRTDLPGGDWRTLVASIGRLLERYEPETRVWPGHGPATTLGREHATNPFLAELRA